MILFQAEEEREKNCVGEGTGSEGGGRVWGANTYLTQKEGFERCLEISWKKARKTHNLKVDLKYKSPLVNSVPWYMTRVYRLNKVKLICAKHPLDAGISTPAGYRTPGVLHLGVVYRTNKM